MSQPSAYRDRALLIPCQGERMLAVLSEPAGAPAGKTGVLVIVGGPQYRTGSHRQFTLLGRALASEGVPTLRLDYRGMGDAEGDLRSFETVGEDVGAAVDAFVQAAGLESVLLWGLCDGASAALLYCEAQQDPRVRGLVLLNPWVRSDNSLAKTQLKHYYWQRLSQPGFWKKLLGGGVGRKAVQDLLANARAACGQGKPRQDLGAAAAGRMPDGRPYPQRMAKAWREFGGAIQLVISGHDLTAKEFLDHAAADPHWRGLLGQGKVQRVDLATADHTFSNRADSVAVQQHTLAFVRQTHL